MCGILGTIRDRDRAGAPESTHFNHALSLLDHRGPDRRGYTVIDDGAIRRHAGTLDRTHDLSGQAVLACCRLAIMDLTAAGDQPMSSADDRVHITFNGEIFNHVELRDELRVLGYTFHSRSDTEVLLAAYQQWGRACLDRLVGMFAFVIVDRSRRVVLLARDHLGIKPLYYTFAGRYGGVAFASQLAALIAISDIRPRGHLPAFGEFLIRARSDHRQETFLSDVEQLRAGHWLEVSLDAPRPTTQERYWRVPAGQATPIAEHEAVARFRDLFEESVRIHLRADVPVAASLSGGMDSSSIVALARALQPQDAPIHTFTFVSSGTPGFDPAWDEEPWADRVGRAVGAEMHKVRVDPHRLPDECERFMLLQDGPFASPVVWVQQQVYRAAHDAGFRAMLSGQGADETMAGYRRHTAARLATLLRRGRLAEYVRLLRAGQQQRDAASLDLRLTSVRLAVPDALGARVRQLSGRDRQPWLHPEYFHDELPVERAAASGLALHDMMRDDIEISPLPALLRYEDRNSMAVSIDNRVPFLNPRIVEFVSALPEALLVSPQGVNKWLLREAMRGIVPPAIIDRKDRVGFPVPLAFWLLELGSWVDTVLGDVEAAPFLNGPVLQKIWRSFRAAGGRPVGDAFVLWRAVFLLVWVRSLGIVFEGRPHQRSA